MKVRFACPVGSELEEDARSAGLEVDALPFARRGRRHNAALLRDLLARHPVDVVSSHSARDRKALTWLGLTRRLTVLWLSPVGKCRGVSTSRTGSQAESPPASLP
mgnify:CR=1 FL=1